MKLFRFNSTPPAIRGDMSHPETGATAIEYGLIAALVAVAAITAMNGVGTQLKQHEPLPEPSIQLLSEAAKNAQKASAELRSEAAKACADAHRTDSGCEMETAERALDEVEN